MSEEVQLPALGESVTEGTVTRWLKQVGDTVEVDEPLLEVATDKVDTEVPSPIAGVLEEILVQEDETVEVGAVLARVGDGSGASAGSGSGDASSAPTPEPEAQDAQEVPESNGSAPVEAPSTETAEPAKAPEPEAKPASSGTGEDVVLPALGESVTEGTITRLLKQVGDTVEIDEPLLEVATDKVDTEVPSPIAGVVQEIYVSEDETVEVGAALVRIGDGAAAESGSAPAEPSTESMGSSAQPSAAAPAEQSTPAASAENPDEADASPATEQPGSTPQQTSQTSGERAGDTVKTTGESESASPAGESNARYVTPIVRKLANERGVDLESIKGTGVGGRIRKEDVLAAADAKGSPSSAPAAASSASAPKAKQPVEISELRGTKAKMSRLRKVVAERAVASMQGTAQLTTVVEVDVTKIAALRARIKDEFQQKTGQKLSFLPFFAVAATEALKTYPIVNATVEGDEIVYPAQENVSIAVDTPRGLLTPVVKNAGDLDIAGYATAIADLAERTRDNKLTPDELSGGTFTLTNTGSRGALFDTPVVFLPQSAILGVGIVAKRPAVVKTEDGAEAIAVRSLVYLALSYDHRIIDGADASRYLMQVKERLETGDFEGDLGI